MKKFLINICSFFALLLVILVIKTVLIEPDISNKVFVSKYNDYLKSAEDKAYNTLFFGSSRIYRHVDPIQFDSLGNNYNIQSYNLGAPGTFNPELYYIFNRFLEDYKNGEVNDSIKYVFIELQRINNLTVENALTEQGSYWLDLDRFMYSMKYISEYDRRTRMKLKIAFSYSVGYVSNLFGLYIDHEYDLEIDTLMQNGFLSLEKELEIEKNQNLIQRRDDFIEHDIKRLSNRTEAITDEAFNTLERGKVLNSLNTLIEKLVNECENQGIQIYFIIPPRQDNDTYKDLIPLTNMHKGRIINLASSTQFPELYEIENSFDVGHLNDKGVKYFTKYLFESFDELLKMTNGI